MMRLIIYTPLKYYEFENIPDQEVESIKNSIVDVMYGIRGHLSITIDGTYANHFFSREMVLQSIFTIQSEV